MEEQTQQTKTKIPEFMETTVKGWFTIIKAQFHLRNMTALKTKSYTVISSLLAKEIAKLPNATLESQIYEPLP